MSIDEDKVAAHYGSADMAGRILSGLSARGLDADSLTVHDLADIDEFHIGGRQATKYALSKLTLAKTDHVIDVGCGIGGAARWLGANLACRVTGIDLTPEFIETAERFTEILDLSEWVDFTTGSALDMPFFDGDFDAAITLHAAMNIADREGLYREVARVLKPGGQFCVYDVMKTGDEPVEYPVPWAATEETSHLVSPDNMQGLLNAAGFDVELVEDRSEFAAQYFVERLAAAKAARDAGAAQGPDPLGPQLVMGETAPQKLRNTRANIAAGRIAPVLMVARRQA